MGIVLILVGLGLGIGVARNHQAVGGQTGAGTLLMFLVSIGLIIAGAVKLFS